MAKNRKNLTKKEFKKLGKYVYGIKRNGKYGRLSSVERAELAIQKGWYDAGRITKQMKTDLDNLLKETQKNVNDKLDALRKFAEETGKVSPALIPSIEFPKDIQDKISEIIRGKLFEQNETSTVEGTDNFFENVGDDLEDIFDNIENETGETIDRWNLMRRVLGVNPEYTQSEVLDIIDELENSGISADEITQIILDTLGENNNMSDDFNDNAENFR